MQSSSIEPTDEPSRASLLRDRFGLFSKLGLGLRSLEQWQERAYQSFIEAVTNPLFPCFFATKAEREGQLVYTFANTSDQPEDLLRIYIALLAYLDHVDHLSGNDKLMATLVVFIRAETPCSAEEYIRKAWELLQFLHDHDTSSWPSDVPSAPDHPSWSFCFDGTPLFVNISTPAHKMRKSRNLGEALTLVIQPRDGFDVVAGDTPSGRQIRNIIRQRIANHDRISPSPELGHYGQREKREWRQYGLPDSDVAALTACPFRSKGTGA